MLGTETLAIALSFPKQILTQGNGRTAALQDRTRRNSVAGARHKVFVHKNSTGAALFMALFIFLLLLCISSLWAQIPGKVEIFHQRPDSPFLKEKTLISLIRLLFTITIYFVDNCINYTLVNTIGKQELLIAVIPASIL